MSEVTWVLILGAIALLFPVIVVSISESLELDVEISEGFGFLDYSQEDYEIVSTLTCDNVFEGNNYDILRQNMFIFFYPENAQWIWKPYIQIGCLFNNNYMENKINETILSDEGSPSELEEYLYSEIEKERSNTLLNRMNPNRFFGAMNEFPDTLKYFIYSFYGLFFAYLIWRTFTIG